MNIIKKAINFAKALIRHGKDGFTDVSLEEYRERLKICNSCEFNSNGDCDICGCIIRKKAWWKSEDCPKNKWDKLT